MSSRFELSSGCIDKENVHCWLCQAKPPTPLLCMIPGKPIKPEFNFAVRMAKAKPCNRCDVNYLQFLNLPHSKLMESACVRIEINLVWV